MLFSCCKKKESPKRSPEKENDNTYLDGITYDNTKVFIPNIQYCKVIKVYDGDTITVASRLPNDLNIYRFSVRLVGIDTPEMRTNNERDRVNAVRARDALSRMILEKVVELRNIRIEKYGRLLAEVYLESLNMSEWMLYNKYAVEYFGGKKNTNVGGI